MANEKVDAVIVGAGASGSVFAAVLAQAGKKVVFIAFDGKALLRPVEVVSQRSGGFLVSGLVGGENVITTAPPSLKDGDKIKIKGQS